MRADLATHPRHPDPALRARLYKAEPPEAAARVAEALGDLEGWGLLEEASREATLVATRRTGFPPRQERVVLEISPGDREGLARLGARVEAEGLVVFAFHARRALREVLWAVDGRLAQAKDSPMRQLGYR